MKTNLRRWLALLLALALLSGAALAEALAPADDEAVEAPVQEQGEIALPGEESQDEPMAIDPDGSLPPEAEPEPQI